MNRFSLDLKALNAGNQFGPVNSFPQNPNNQFAGQPRQLVINIAQLLSEVTKAKQEFSGYWLALCIGGSTPGAVFKVQFDQMSPDAAITLRPGQAIYLPFQNFTLTSIGITSGAATFKLGTSAETAFEENAATAPGGTLEVLSGEGGVGATAAAGDDATTNVNAPQEGLTVAGALTAGALALLGCKSLRVLLTATAGVIQPGASIRFWYGRESGGVVVWYPGDVYENIAALGEVAARPYPLTGNKAVTSDIQIASPFGYIWAQLLGFVSIPAGTCNVTIQRL